MRLNVLLVFSKLPEVGLVKTRLSTLKDGWLSPERASYLYHCMLFDVAEICCAALDGLERAHPGEEYRLVISTAPEANLPKMEALFAESGTWPRPISFICDKGANFDEHYNHAFSQCWEMGADSILSIGADMPALHSADIVRGFEALRGLAEEGVPGIVLAPDQEMGVSMVGWTRETAFDHTGIYYCQNGLTVLPAYIDKARQLGLRAVYLPSIPDVDTMADLMHNITLVDALCYCAESGDGTTPPWRTRAALESFGLSEVRVMPNDLLDPRDAIDRADGTDADPGSGETARA